MKKLFLSSVFLMITLIANSQDCTGNVERTSINNGDGCCDFDPGLDICIYTFSGNSFTIKNTASKIDTLVQNFSDRSEVISFEYNADDALVSSTTSYPNLSSDPLDCREPRTMYFCSPDANGFPTQFSFQAGGCNPMGKISIDMNGHILHIVNNRTAPALDSTAYYYSGLVLDSIVYFQNFACTPSCSMRAIRKTKTSYSGGSCDLSLRLPKNVASLAVCPPSCRATPITPVTPSPLGPTAQTVPTLGEWGLIILGLILIIFGVSFLVQKSAVTKIE